jgi:hypothetical protein
MTALVIIHPIIPDIITILTGICPLSILALVGVGAGEDMDMVVDILITPITLIITIIGMATTRVTTMVIGMVIMAIIIMTMALIIMAPAPLVTVLTAHLVTGRGLAMFPGPVILTMCIQILQVRVVHLSPTKIPELHPQ